ncbi:hypothetical protein D9V37_15435 [Nocardioides mangrovicus]|uniref:Glucanase n=1 Tax=Nocardioides mangrovicus TaxID=2478913 RepID=A0A3L8NXB1_9ACTN|nr:glycoside hydrolase family 6 protein [Nocardioides mangrovicus]RLV47564.1 hypothetical protein D9V37_15435 [Nocardioides mangrovicus]
MRRIAAALAGLLAAGVIAAAAHAAPPTDPTALAVVTAAHVGHPPKPKPPPAPPNPLASLKLGVYQGNDEQAWAPYARSRGENRKLLAKIALRQKAKWYGAWVSNGAIEGKVRAYVEGSTHGRSDTFALMALFRVVPWEGAACHRVSSGGEQASYRQWIDNVARGIGSSHVVVILQPDGPFVTCAPHHSAVPSQLIAYASRKLSALPHTYVYIDGGASDWPWSRSEAASFLIADGVRYARGIALNSTHYGATGDEVQAGAEIVQELARRGIKDKHVVVNTSSNGRPVVFGQAPGKDHDNATVCASRSSQRCVTLGIPPTTDVANARWPLTARQRTMARDYVDAYLWFGRPWLYRQADPFDYGRALQLARTTPY